jgi:hypothetical protein
MTRLQRLIITFKDEELVLHAIYRDQDGANPGTKARQRQVTELVRTGLRDALEALEGRVDVVGTSGYSVREDLLSVALPRPYEAREAAS